MTPQDEQHLEYHHRPYSIECRECKKRDEITQADAVGQGWTLSKAGEFCPDHSRR